MLTIPLSHPLLISSSTSTLTPLILLSSLFHHRVNRKSMRALNLTSLPTLAANSSSGDSFYNTSNTTDTWYYGYGNSSIVYGSTAFTTYIRGNTVNGLELALLVKACPDTGCTNVPETVTDVRSGVLLWSDNATWNNTQLFPRGAPKDGDNVTIPNGESVYSRSLSSCIDR